MSMRLPPYPVYRDSGVSWLGDVPAHWSGRSLGSLTTRVSKRNRPDLPLLSVVRERGVIPRASMSNDENHNFVPDDLTNYQVVREGNLVINKMKAWQGSVGIAPVDGIVSPAYFVFDLQIPNREFAHVLLRSRPYAAFFAQVSDGVRIGQWDLSIAGMRRVPVFIPSPEEQQAIVRFLARMDSRINRLIRAKRRLIELLNEQKQAIIHRAVTRGLDPNVRLKASGIDWLGEVPEHWGMRSFTRCSIERADYRGATPAKTENGVFLVTARNIRKGWIDYETSKEYVAEEDYATIMRRGLPRCGDLLLTMEAPLGNAALVDREDIALAQRVVRFRLNPHLLDPQFTLESVLSPYFQQQMLRRGTGSTALGIKASKLPQLQLLVPPLGEQKAILEHFRVECSPMSRAIDQATSEINLLREYRTRLIADVVTGKLDVRGVALPAVEEGLGEGLELGDEDVGEMDGDADEVMEDGEG